MPQPKTKKHKTTKGSAAANDRVETSSKMNSDLKLEPMDQSVNGVVNEIVEDQVEAQTNESHEPIQVQSDEFAQNAATGEIMATIEVTPKEKTEEEIKQTEIIPYFGRNLVKEKLPQVDEAIEVVLRDWKNDGDFETLAVPLEPAKKLLVQGLQKAKNTEKTLEVMGVLPLVREKITEVKGKYTQLVQKGNQWLKK